MYSEFNDIRTEFQIHTLLKTVYNYLHVKTLNPPLRPPLDPLSDILLYAPPQL